MGKAYDDCPGYWDSDLNWHEAPVDPQRFIIEDFSESLGVWMPPNLEIEINSQD